MPPKHLKQLLDVHVSRLNRTEAMKYFSKLSFFYYTSTAVVSGSIILLFLHLIQWPVLAEVILGTTLFIHGLILARTIKDLAITAHQKGILSDLYYQIKHGYEMSESNPESER